MSILDAGLWVGFILAGAAAVLEAIGMRRPDGPWTRYAAWAATGSAAIFTAGFLLLCVLFLTLQLDVAYVWTYTGTWISWPYRLAGAWTGREGSLLLWTAATALVVAGFALRDQRHPAPREKAWTRLVLFALLAFFALAVARQGTFGPTPDYLLSGRPDGNGINPTLVSPFILIHPPMMFVAYALTVIPAAAALGHLITGSGAWSRDAGTWSKANWILYTVAMGLGGIWAYYTLGFGGYWAWDPVEVANLLPWLALTIYVHAAMAHARWGALSGAGPLLGILPFVLTVFSTVSTRSGLWVSVHAFTDPTNAFDPDAASRLLGILGVDASLAPYFAILLATLLGGLALWNRRLAADHAALGRVSRFTSGVLVGAAVLALFVPVHFLSAVFEVAALTGSVGFGALALLAIAVLAAAAPLLVGDDEAVERTRWLSVRGLATVSVLLLSLALVVSLLWHFGAVNGWSEAFWDARVPWLLTPMALALVVLLLRGVLGRERALQAAGGALVVAIVAALLGGLPAYAVALSLAVLAAAVAKMHQVGTRGTLKHRVGGTLLVAGAWANVVFWINPPSVLLGAIHVGWPIQVPMVALALLALAGAHRQAMGEQRRWVAPLVGALGAYYVAPLLAAASWWLSRDAAAHRVSPARLRGMATYGIHFAVALLFVGYAASTYYEDKVSLDADVGGALSVGTQELQLASIDTTGTPFVDRFDVHVTKGDRTATGELGYEPRSGAYFPLPGTLRTWTGDVYVQVDAVCWEPAAECTGDDWVDAYESTFPRRGDGAPMSAKLTVHWLPGIGMVWASLALFAAYGLPIAFIGDRAVRPIAETARNRA